MSSEHAPIKDGIKLAAAAAAAAAAAVIVGGMVLLGWAFDIGVLKSVLPGWVSMKANTATCFILIGIALWLTAHPLATLNSQRSILFFRLARFFNLLVGLIGLLTLGEYISGWNLGIDQWLFREPVGTVGTPHPGRMTAEAALLFVLLAAALWITVGSRKNRWVLLASMILSLLVTILAVSEILSYAIPGLGPYVWFGFHIMAMHSAILFALLGMAVIANSWQQDVLQWSLGRKSTAAFACGLAVLVFIGLTINRSQFWLDETNLKITSSEEVLNEIVSIQIELTEAQAHTRGYVITGEEGFRGAYLGDIFEYHTKMDALRQRIADNPQQQQQISLIETNADLLQRWTQQFIDAPRTGKNTTHRKMDIHGDEFMDSIHATFDQIENEHRQLIRELKQKSESVERLSFITITTGTLTSLLIFLIAIFRLNSAVNERKQAEEKIRQLNAELETKVQQRTRQLQDAQEELVRKEKLAVLGQVAGSVGHELRNPLGVMSNAVYYLQTVLPNADETTREYLNIIKDEIAVSERMASDLMDAVCTKPPQPEAVGIAELIAQTLRKCSVPTSVTVKLDIPATLSALRVDAMQIHQVLRNLISNGVEAMPEGGVLEIRAVEDTQAKTIAISVKDSGTGMTLEQLGHLFQPLFTTKARGIGLGLVVVKNLTEANGGSVGVESKLGKGSVFSVTLPSAGL